MQLWLVGVNRNGEGTVWEFIGVFDDRDKAIAACFTKFHFFAPVTLNEPAKDATQDFPDCVYPVIP